MTDEMIPAGQHWLTGRVLADRELRWYLEALAARREPAGPEDLLAMRQRLDEQIRDAIRWPGADDYTAVARDLTAIGQSGVAEVFRRAAHATRLADEAEARWEHRYAHRPQTGRERVYQDLLDGGPLSFGAGQPARGIDGALYLPGHVSDGALTGFAVAVHARGAFELVTGFAGYADQQRWIADRGTTATGPLRFPEAGDPPRVTLEEQVLAGFLADPGSFAACAAKLPPDTFTSDARYEIYAAMLHLDARPRSWYGWQVPDEITRRSAWLPGQALREAGGSGAPLISAYCDRLAVTEVSASAAEAAARTLHAEDTRGRARPSWPGLVAAGKAALRTAEPGELPDVARWRQIRRRAEPGRPPRRPAGFMPPAPAAPAGPEPRI